VGGRGTLLDEHTAFLHRLLAREEGLAAPLGRGSEVA